MFLGRLSRLAQPIEQPVTAAPPTGDDLFARDTNALLADRDRAERIDWIRRVLIP